MFWVELRFQVSVFFTFNFLKGFHFQLVLREALRWKARKGGSRWGRGGKKASL